MMTPWGVVLTLAWPLVVLIILVFVGNRYLTRIDTRADQVDSRADEVETAKRTMEEIEQRMKGTADDFRRDARKIHRWTRAGQANTPSSVPRDPDDPPTDQVDMRLPLTRDQLIRSEGASAQPPRYRRRDDDSPY